MDIFYCGVIGVVEHVINEPQRKIIFALKLILESYITYTYVFLIMFTTQSINILVN